MLDWRVRFAAAGLIASFLVMLMGCGASTSTPSSTFSITPSAVLLGPAQTFQFNVATADIAAAAELRPLLLVNGLAGGSPSTGTITSGGLYTAPSSVSGQQITISIKGQSASAVVTLFNPAKFTPGSVVATQNPLVASYSITVPAGTSVQAQFGPDTNYGLTTSIVESPLGGEVTILVAGMRAETTYHIHALVNLANGIELPDADHPFTTGSIPAERVPNITAQQFGGGAPSEGIELFSLIPYTPGNLLSAVATDLEGNVIWYYNLESTAEPFPVKPLPNGHMLVVVASPGFTPVNNEIREIDLAGNIINRITLDAVNKSLPSTADFQLATFHHDVAILPNGHWILLGNFTQTINNVPGIPAGTMMLGDGLVDWDPQNGAVWTWSTFDHLDPTHAPFGLTDWTHSNAIIYSPDDGNLILSMRNQDWVIKINYSDGAGDGSVLWRLGEGGDFTLPGQEAPIDWNYGQHYVTVVSPNSAGVFSLMFFDNGNNRLMDANDDICGSSGVGACYSSVEVVQLNEFTKNATVLWQDDLLPAYSICCGDALLLPNGNIEFDVAYDVGTPHISHIEEATQAQKLIWKMDIDGQLAYRGFRIPSLYPGQVWPTAALSAPRRVLSRKSRASSAAAVSAKEIERLP